MFNTRHQKSYRHATIDYQPLFKSESASNSADTLSAHVDHSGFYVLVNTMRRKTMLLIEKTKEQIIRLEKALQYQTDASALYRIREMAQKVIADIEMAIAFINSIKARVLSNTFDAIRQEAAYVAAWEFLETQKSEFLALRKEISCLEELASREFKSCYLPL